MCAACAALLTVAALPVAAQDAYLGFDLDLLAKALANWTTFKTQYGEKEGNARFEAWLEERGQTRENYDAAWNLWWQRWKSDPTGKLQARFHTLNSQYVNELNFAEFVTGCCTPIDSTLSVMFTVDHEEMDAGDWSLGISSCSPSAPGDITPASSGPGVTVTPRGGSGTIVEDTSAWTNCSYTVTLSTRPGLTTGLVDRTGWANPLTFAICGH